MLLDISEPGIKTKDKHKLAVGIDLGTTFTLVAIWENGVAKCLSDINDSNSILIPSIVHFAKDGDVDVGEPAKPFLINDAKNTITSSKRLIGKILKEIQHLENYVYDFQDREKIFAIKTRQGYKTPTEISAEILKNVRQRVLGHYPNQLAISEPLPAVITVPAYFDEGQRQATKDAAKIANIKVLRLLNEPTSAAIAYRIDPNLDDKKNGIYLVYDLGGGTFDVSVLKLSKGIFQVLATAGNTNLGGDDFDRRIYCWLQEEFRQPFPSEQKILNLHLLAKKAREQLSNQSRVEINFQQNNKTYQATLTREILSRLTKELTEQTLILVKKAMSDAKISKHSIKKVLLIGGATKMPIIQNSVCDFFGKSKVLFNTKKVNPDTAVACGASRQADILIGNKSNENEHLLLDVLPLSLGIETYGGLSEKIINRNSTLPIAKSQEFTTHIDGQTNISIHIIQGERELVQDCRSLAYFELKGIPPMPAGIPRIQVDFNVDTDGLLTVSAFEKTSKSSAAFEVKPTYGLNQDEVINMIQESMKKAEADLSARQLAEEMVIAEQLISSVNKALDEDYLLLENIEIEKIKQLIKQLAELIKQPKIKIKEIKNLIAIINSETEEFAHLRMNTHIIEAIKGRKLDDINENQLPSCALIEK